MRFSALSEFMVTLVVCTTCRGQGVGRAGGSGGEAFLRMLETCLVARSDVAGLRIQKMACLFACTSHCVVYLRAEKKMGYLLGRFPPDYPSTQALLDYIAHYKDSANGEVPYSYWPELVKGRFIARIPPADLVLENGT